jgi:hypothetical protein
MAAPAAWPQPPEGAEEQRKAGPPEQEPGPTHKQALGRRRPGRLEIEIRRARKLAVEAAGQHGQALELSRIRNGVALPFEALQPIDDLGHGRRLALHEPVGLLGQPRDRLLAGDTLRARILVERADHAAEFVDRAADALAVLLREFRGLGGCKAENRPIASARTRPMTILPPRFPPTKRREQPGVPRPAAYR